MQISAECRWFTQNAATGKALRDWFLDASIHGCRAGGGRTRNDEYLVDPSQTELGIKRRGSSSSVEIKGLVSKNVGLIGNPSFDGVVEIWSKWTTSALNLASFPTIHTAKNRWLRKFDTSSDPPFEVALLEDEQPQDGQSRPAQGCNVEFTTIQLSGATWHSFGFEGFGDLETVELSVRRVAEVMASRNPPQLRDAMEASYPKWLSSLKTGTADA